MTGSPVNDAKGRWRPGGGINVPVGIEITLPKRQANEIRRTVYLSSGISAQTTIDDQDNDCFALSS